MAGGDREWLSAIIRIRRDTSRDSGGTCSRGGKTGSDGPCSRKFYQDKGQSWGVGEVGIRDRSLSIMQARIPRSGGRTEVANFNTIPFPGPWTFPGCLEATVGPEPTANPVSSAGCSAGGWREDPRGLCCRREG